MGCPTVGMILEGRGESFELAYRNALAQGGTGLAVTLCSKMSEDCPDAIPDPIRIIVLDMSFETAQTSMGPRKRYVLKLQVEWQCTRRLGCLTMLVAPFMGGRKVVQTAESGSEDLDRSTRRKLLALVFVPRAFGT